MCFYHVQFTRILRLNDTFPWQWVLLSTLIHEDPVFGGFCSEIVQAWNQSNLSWWCFYELHFTRILCLGTSDLKFFNLELKESLAWWRFYQLQFTTNLCVGTSFPIIYTSSLDSKIICLDDVFTNFNSLGPCVWGVLPEVPHKSRIRSSPPLEMALGRSQS